MTDIDGPTTKAPPTDDERRTAPSVGAADDEDVGADAGVAVDEEEADVGQAVGTLPTSTATVATEEPAPSAGQDGGEAGRGTGAAADVRVSFPTRSTPWRAVAVVLAFAVVIGLGSWQFVDLHNQVHHLQRTAKVDEQQIVAQERQVATLHDSVRAALSCLETPQVQPSVCAHFLR